MTFGECFLLFAVPLKYKCPHISPSHQADITASKLLNVASCVTIKLHGSFILLLEGDSLGQNLMSES